MAFGIVSLILWPITDVSAGPRFFYALLLVIAVFVGLFINGRRRQRKAAAAAGAPPKR